MSSNLAVRQSSRLEDGIERIKDANKLKALLTAYNFLVELHVQRLAPVHPAAAEVARKTPSSSRNSYLCDKPLGGPGIPPTALTG